MADTDWREILSYSQRDLIQADKEKLCESLSWMEADDIELNFTDLKTLFRLAQDILKFKTEQVNNLKGQMETLSRKGSKKREKASSYLESPAKSSDSIIETINHQEEVIKANKEILEQLFTDIAELEKKKSKLEDDKDSESSRDVLSELNEVAQLENEVTLKNRHIRKLINDVKILEEENRKVKEKFTVIKDKLKEATNVIENLTEQLYTLKDESTKLKGVLGKLEEQKANLVIENENLRKDIAGREANKDSIYDDIKSKALHWKNIAKHKKTEVESLLNENTKLKESLHRSSQSTSSPKKVQSNLPEESKIKELQEKLSQASKEIERSADLIEKLKSQNRELKIITDESITDYQSTENKNESDESKEKSLINKLKRKTKNLSIALQEAEEMISLRDKELADITLQLQLVKSHDGINALVEGLKNKKKQLKSRDEGIKSLVQEVNSLNEYVDNLQLENESLRQKLNLPRSETIPKKGILKKLYDMERNYEKIDKTLKKTENKIVSTELDNHILKKKCNKMISFLNDQGYSKEAIEEINREDSPIDQTSPSKKDTRTENGLAACDCKAQAENILDENEGLRKGLQELLNFIKDNSTTSSGVLTLQCPSLDSVLQSMEARHAAGWFAPHMSTVMELRAALGGKDALLVALHEARKETYETMAKLSKETQKSTELEKKIHEFEVERETKPELTSQDCMSTKSKTANIGEFGSWFSFEENNVDFYDREVIENHISIRNQSYEDYLRKGLKYFHEKFKVLFEKMTSVVIQTADQQNQWSTQEEQYKAEIENLKIQLTQKNDEDYSEHSPGVIIDIPNTTSLERKCTYLEDSYKYIRTVNENLKNEILDIKKESMLLTSEYDSQIQNLMLLVANIFDKLRSSISIEAFWKQNTILNETIINNRIELNKDFKAKKFQEFVTLLENQKEDLITAIKSMTKDGNNDDRLNTILSNINDLMSQYYDKKINEELDEKNKKIEMLETKNKELQELQTRIIDETIAADTKEEISFMKIQVQKIEEENKILKEQSQVTGRQLDIALLQLNDSQQRQLSNDIEVNMLRHQILDLQSTGDNKAIIARLSGEVLVAHLQASEFHKKIERLTSALHKEKQLKIEAEDMLEARQKIFDIYTARYESKFRYMYEVIQMLRQQYYGSIPLTSLENYVNKLEELNRNTYAANEKLKDIEDLQYSLMTKHSVYEQVLDLSKNKCLDDPNGCPHKLQILVLENMHVRDEKHLKEKIYASENSRQDILNHCKKLENTLILLNQGFEKPILLENEFAKSNNKQANEPQLQIEDIQSDEESSGRQSQTVTLTKPQILKPINNSNNNIESANIEIGGAKTQYADTYSQTINNIERSAKSTQTDDYQNIQINKLQTDIDEICRKKAKIELDMKQKSQEILDLKTKLEYFVNLNNEKDNTHEKLIIRIKEFEKQIEEIKDYQITQRNKLKEEANQENKTLLSALKQSETEKNNIISEYTKILNNERQEYSNSTQELHTKMKKMQAKLDNIQSDTSFSQAKSHKDDFSKHTLKITNLEDQCFKIKSELEACKTELNTCNSEMERWKELANERLSKMELLKSQLEQRHSDEVESYKAENQHWLTQLNETQREHMELRSRLSEQKAIHIKQMADKDALIEQLRSTVHNLKTQIINMQTMISVNDPSFDLTAIVEVDESCDGVSQHGSDRLELKFDSSVDMNEMHDDMMRIPASSTAIWQEPVIERLRREKQLAYKQNTILRRQIKALAARERRARLDAQNLKNQIYRISTSGSKAATAETVALQSKIASLQAQLTSERRDTSSSIALWDKWKRSQQSSDRWQARYEEKCQDVKKMEVQLNLAKSAVVRLEREKRLLLMRLTEVKNEKQLTFEKQETEDLEKRSRVSETERSQSPPPPVSARALLDRVQAQQRRIAALEIAEKGNEILVSEYEKALAEITSLKGQVLKLESTILESQIRSPVKITQDSQPEVDHWKSYCEMLKEENVQLNLKVNAHYAGPATADQHRVNDLEMTVLTLRGLVSKLQAEQKSSTVQKRVDSRPNSGRSFTDKTRSKSMDSHRIEISNLKRSIQEKDMLLEKSKEMLKIAAEREDELLRENSYLRRQLADMSHSKPGFLSA